MFTSNETTDFVRGVMCQEYVDSDDGINAYKSREEVIAMIIKLQKVVPTSKFNKEVEKNARENNFRSEGGKKLEKARYKKHQNFMKRQRKLNAKKKKKIEK